MQSLFSVSFFVLSVADPYSCFVVFSIFMDWIVFPPKRYIIAVTPGVSECDLIWKRGCCWRTQFAVAAKSLQSCPTLWDPRDGSPPGSPVPGILQARILEWVAISFSNAWKWKMKVKSPSSVWLLATPWTAACHASLSFIISWSLLKFMSIESMMPSNHLIMLCHPLLWLVPLGRGKRERKKQNKRRMLYDYKVRS